MPIPIQPEGILLNRRRMQATLHTAGRQAAPYAGNDRNRHLKGTIRLIDERSFRFATWEWEATAQFVKEGIYRFGPILILQEPGSSNVFSNDRLDALNENPSDAKTAEEAAALYLLDALICLAAGEPARIADAMILPQPAAPSVRNGIYRHYKGKEYLVEGVACAAGYEHLPAYAQEWSVIYRPLYGDYGLRTRPYAEFTEIVNRDGHDGPRFVFVRQA